MIHVMDGVRPTTRRPKPLILATPKPDLQARPAETRRYVVGMDGIRRPVPPAPRDVIAAMQAAPAMVAEAEAPVWAMPSLRLPQIAWKRPAIAFGLVATALVTTTAMAGYVTHQQPATARASSGHAAQASAPAPKAAAAAPAAAPQKAGLQQLLDGFVAANPDKFGIVVKDLTTGETASVNAERQIASASLYKLFVAQRIYQRIDLGQLDYGTPAGGGTGRNVDQCLTIMINISDNACGWALGGGILGWGAQDQALEIEGYKQTSLATPQKTSAADVATLLGRLYSGTLVSGNASERFLGLLKDQRVNNRLPQGLPAGTVIAHKTGDLNDVVHDAGIVYGPKTNYLVVVTSGGWTSPGNAPALFADLSGKLWNYFEQ
jgi:beta-lactamase class A